MPVEFEDCIGIFQGGGCRAAVYAGAYAAATARGVNFSEVAGASAGSIAAVLIAAGATPEWLKATLKNLDFKLLLSKPKGRRFAADGDNRATQIWNLLRFNGMHDAKGLETWVEDRLRELLPAVTNKKVLFGDLPKPVSVIAANLELQGPHVWSKDRTPEASVAKAVRSSCTLPFFFQPHGPYVDGGVVSNLPLHVIENDESDRRRVLAFTLIDNQRAERPTDVMSTAMALAGTVTGGGQVVQSAVHNDIDMIEINCGDIRATDFDRMNEGTIETLVNLGRSAVDSFFDAGVTSITPVKPSQVSTHQAQTLSAIAAHLLNAKSTVTIATRDTKWVFELFTALLLVRLKGIPVSVVLQTETTPSPPARQQRETLEAMGCNITLLPLGDKPEVQAFICDAGTSGAVAVVLSKEDLEIHARLFTSSDGDEDTINLLDASLRARESQHASVNEITIAPAPDAAVIDSLRTVTQYSTGQDIVLREVEVTKIDSWARYAHVYKQTQQRAMLRKLREYGLDEFKPYFVSYGTGRQSLALPIVVEESPSGRCTVVNGLSRLLLLKREGRDRVLCAVVSGAIDQAPAKGVVNLSDLGVRVGVRGDATHRYPGFVYRNLRSVENDAHRLRRTT